LTITVAAFGGFALLFTLFTKLFPIISVWEMREGWEVEQSSAVPVSASPTLRPLTSNPQIGGEGHD
jgi:hypothetical protein